MESSAIKLIEGNWDKHSEALKEALKRGDTPIQINCLGSKDFELGPKQSFRSVKIKTKDGNWQRYDCLEYEDTCPVCLKLMLVRAIRGSSWLACCSDECYKKYQEYRDAIELEQKQRPQRSLRLT